ncbi:Ubiquinone/menaquinone biosynthesis C-methylase UbiE [Azotobacter beijerinckii]|uniref:Ubiquinone/menaquinone biosynthesis C-methylase UbiE n=1 Tax=Azotobacter beijerinckii TaxID=170623 RepID=A0A1H6RRK5_9GAMM|nr:class I SAM-dependent methyltransferase [Azotobacter beijerinckii]SEI56084.1 Ubiquinone/menaquinone biosynthesis C-methylase UbiE [Azotobacter beijerinckii]SEJ47761.1 Ubiquinone/menaquinone biosynthesis C-methylase UbiE [Azotobacter beijerinckii]
MSSRKHTCGLELSHQLGQTPAVQLLLRHCDRLVRRLSHWRDGQLARRALKQAGEPNLVLDLPCGAGRFWPLLTEQPNRVVLAADSSAEILSLVKASHTDEVLARVRTFQTSPFAIDLPDNAVDSIFSMRLLHHVADREGRLAILREFQRVSRDSLIVSLWVDGNFKAWRRRHLARRRAEQEGREERRKRFVVDRATIEAEFGEAGFDIVGHHDALPGYAMRRIYVLYKRTSA